ncbi:leucine-rich repeat extensin-like protein 5 [Etheostoma spectabile]|uniref:leucine-rich repeat extensin-like protein 5 n=1 Tax=Etheostoma spectabile TaxID=54343 RepID=UPI0013AE905C|nr:leucine-rich repeat extensin-like protein 5 [Etheostoma spectabile]
MFLSKLSCPPSPLVNQGYLSPLPPLVKPRHLSSPSPLSIVNAGTGGPESPSTSVHPDPESPYTSGHRSTPCHPESPSTYGHSQPRTLSPLPLWSTPHPESPSTSGHSQPPAPLSSPPPLVIVQTPGAREVPLPSGHSQPRHPESPSPRVNPGTLSPFPPLVNPAPESPSTLCPPHPESPFHLWSSSTAPALTLQPPHPSPSTSGPTRHPDPLHTSGQPRHPETSPYPSVIVTGTLSPLSTLVIVNPGPVSPLSLWSSQPGTLVPFHLLVKNRHPESPSTCWFNPGTRVPFHLWINPAP